MANPNIAQGTLNRIKASVLFPSFPQLNVSVSYLSPEGIDCAPQGQATGVLPTMTGVVTAPEPYQIMRVTLHLLKSQGFADLWKQQWESSTLLGDFTVRPDAPTLKPFLITNGSIMDVDRMSFSGRSPDFIVNIAGTYSINSALWN